MKNSLMGANFEVNKKIKSKTVRIALIVGVMAVVGLLVYGVTTKRDIDLMGFKVITPEKKETVNSKDTAHSQVTNITVTSHNQKGKAQTAYEIHNR